jgi:hypothetical protein
MILTSIFIGSEAGRDRWGGRYQRWPDGVTCACEPGRTHVGGGIP